ncbi:MAG: hypothetical protein COA62_16695 [Rhodobiaceae bacterium]|nr:MAG: hypothetical protein COA62_16695 [Rhodobiaceae bacterium]
MNDDDWIWGGKLEDIHLTIQHGIRWDADDDSRFNEMPRFLADEILEPAQVSDITDFVLAISSQQEMTEAATRGAGLFAAECSSCHMDDGAGNKELGAPNLTDTLWLYGGSRAAVYETIANARAGQMPSWGARLDPVTVKQLALYVHSLGGGE